VPTPVYPLGVQWGFTHDSVGVTGSPAELTGDTSANASLPDYGSGASSFDITYNGVTVNIALTADWTAANATAVASALDALVDAENWDGATIAASDSGNYLVLTAEDNIASRIVVSGAEAATLFGGAIPVPGVADADDEWTLTVTGTATADGEAYINWEDSTLSPVSITKDDDAIAIVGAIDSDLASALGGHTFVDNSDGTATITLTATPFSGATKPSITFLPLEAL
jgi:hypothetical protein